MLVFDLIFLQYFFYFYFVLGKNKRNIEEKSNQKQASIKEESKTSDMVSSLDEFLDDDELNRWLKQL